MNKKGFTLVEMLIVIVIIGILAAALIPRLTGIQARARDVARAGDLQQMTSALALYYIDNNAYPTGTGTFVDAAGLAGDLGTYLKSFPSDPQNLEYGYATIGTLAAVAAVNESNRGNWNNTGTPPTITYTALTGDSQTTSSSITTGNAVIVIQ